MSISINHKALAYSPLDTDKKRNRANNFVNKNDREVSQMATRAVSIHNNESNRKFGKRLSLAFNSIPFVAVASGLAMKRGIKPSLKNGAEWGLAVAIPAIVSKANNTAIKSSDNIKSAEKKHANLSFGAEIGLSLAGFFGASALLDKASKNAKVNKIVDTVIDGTKDTLGKIKKEIKVPESLTQKVSKVAEKVKIPEFAKTAYNKVASSNVAKNVIASGKKIGKKAVKNAPMLVALGVIGAVFGAAVKQSSQISEVKSVIKKDQLDTARNLIGTYKQENEELKAQLAEKAE